MSADVDKLMRSILIQAETATDLNTFVRQLRIIAGAENAALVRQMLEEEKPD